MEALYRNSTGIGHVLLLRNRLVRVTMVYILGYYPSIYFLILYDVIGNMETIPGDSGHDLEEIWTQSHTLTQSTNNFEMPTIVWKFVRK